jgi:hypothetical protein
MYSHETLQETRQNLFCHVKNVDRDTMSYVKTLDSPLFRPNASDSDQDTIVHLKIMPFDDYASCRGDELSIHSDYATFETPNRFTFTHCITPDPKFPNYGKSLIFLPRKALEYIEKHESKLFHFLTTTPVPFCRNVEHDLYHKGTVPHYLIYDKSIDRIRFDKTLILPTLNASFNLTVLERSAYNMTDAQELARMVEQFDHLCHIHAEKIEIALNKNEGLFIDNWKVLHSRGECSVVIDQGKVISREVNLAFLL